MSFEEILEKMKVATDKIATGQRFRKEFTDFINRDLSGEFDNLTDEEIDEVIDEILKTIKGIDYQFLKGLMILDDLSSPEEFEKLKDAWSRIPTAFGTGLYFREWCDLVIELISEESSGSGDRFETMGPYQTQQEACDAFAVDGFQEEFRLYLEEETEGVYLVYTDSERTQLADDGIYIINDNIVIFEDDILIIEVENGYIQSSASLSAVCFQ